MRLGAKGASLFIRKLHVTIGFESKREAPLIITPSFADTLSVGSTS